MAIYHDNNNHLHYPVHQVDLEFDLDHGYGICSYCKSTMNSLSQRGTSSSYYYTQDETAMTIQVLNNRACVLLAMGCFSKANHLLETALLKHKESMTRQLVSGSPCCCCSYHANDRATAASSPPRRTHPYHHAMPSSTRSSSSSGQYEHEMDLTFDDDIDDSFSVSDDNFDEYYNNNKDNGNGNSMLIDSSRTNINANANNAAPTTSIHPPSSSLFTDNETTTTNATTTNTNTTTANNNTINPAFRQGIPRMTMTSKLQTIPYAGQEASRVARNSSAKKLMYHQVYSLPIVMDEIEWENATMDDRSFVLIFNSAVSNHLWGMRTSKSTSTAASTATPSFNTCSINDVNASNNYGSNDDNADPWELFHTAKKLYKIGLEYIKQNIQGVDKICIPAVFNNLSHLCKTLEGEASQEAYYYDTVLLKAIYWWIDSSSTSPSSSHSSSSFNTIRNNYSSYISNHDIINNYRDDDNYRSTFYDDDNAEIIDAFLENCFYLVSISPTDVPAAAA
mmetsp:Transcript_27626/g.60825  ORF Transcript_27626/g.60825 Transcript_27626/m.60825 type:complete len:507 (+) Transcript_27626:97-1617(+)